MGGGGGGGGGGGPKVLMSKSPKGPRVNRSKRPKDLWSKGPRYLKVTFKYELDSKEGPMCFNFHLLFIS